MEISWSTIKPKEFEKLCCLILEANGFSDIQWFGRRGSDKGRDIIARRTECPLPSLQIQSRWVIQCKRYVAKPPSKTDLASFLASAREHKPDRVLIVVTNTLSSGTKDWLHSVREDYPFQVYLWEENDLGREIQTHKRQIVERFPRIFSRSDPVSFYHFRGNEVRFVCQEFDEISIVVMNRNESNKEDVNQARGEVAEFIQFLKQNEISHDWPLKQRGNS